MKADTKTAAPSDRASKLVTSGGAEPIQVLPHPTTDQGELVEPHVTEAEARADIAAMEPIMAIEGRQMSDADKELLVDLIRGTKTFEEITKILAREAGYDID
ncbi:hypothetical protein [Rhodococcus sp. YH1]|uniref:hypothetical protein n=1 Tax=Rhodococcus sp. YH1 TaxID=89066 RepID=UPI00192E6730|nr:hypothetical protein [Rhodococcus sp. YH1]